MLRAVLDKYMLQAALDKKLCLERFQLIKRQGVALDIRATAAQMVQAGLYYLGERDRVKCWYCNGGLQNWSFNDDPWYEHAKWFPLCEYVLQNKGPEYIENVTQQHPNLARPTMAGVRRPLDPHTDAITGSRRPREQFTERSPPIIDPGEERRKKQAQIEKEMQTSEIIQVAFEMGFERHHIKKALTMRIDAYGRGFGKVETLITDLTQLQEQAEIEGEEDHGVEVTPKTVGSEEAELKTILQQEKCRICQKERVVKVLLPCGHLATCKDCGNSTNRCPICQVKVASRIVAFRV